MLNRMPEVDYQGLDRLLGALAESVAGRVHLDETALSESLPIPETLPDAWRDTATAVQVDTLPRGVSLLTVSRGVLGHFLPAASVVFVPVICLWVLFEPFDYATQLRFLQMWSLSTVGFGLGLGALSPWLYPHSNPDGQRSELAGFVSSFAWIPIGLGFAGMLRLIVAVPGMAWLVPLLNAIPFWGLFLLSGMTLAVLAYAPWLRRTSRIATPSPPGRWTKLRATAVSGGLGAIVFGSAQAIRFLIPPLLTGARLWPVSFYRLVWGTSKGFVIGAAFALALAVVFRRYAVEELRAWKVGLWAAAAASLPTLAILIDRAYHDLVLFPEPLSDLMNVLTGAILPGFLMGYLAVKLAQRSRPSG